MNEEKDMKSLQESEEQYGSCAERELMQSLDASASQLTADDVAYLEKREKALILMDKYYEPKKYIFMVNGINCVSIGDLHLIQAQAKQGKSTLVTILGAVCRCGHFGPVEYALDHPCKVIVFDTEQFEADSQSQIIMMHKLGEDDNGTKITMLNLRMFVFEERTDFIKQTIMHEKPTFVIIDGIRDLIPDINDPVGCPMLVQELMQLASEASCAILGVLHNNPSDGKARGWLGTEWINKCGYSFEVQKSGSVVTVKTPVFRGAPVPDWKFVFGEGKKPTCDPDFIAHRQKVDKAVEESNKAAMAKAKRQDEINLVIDQLKKVGGKMKRSDFVDKMTNEGTFKKSHLQELIKEMIESEDIPLMTADSFIFVNANSTTKNVSDEDIPIF